MNTDANPRITRGSFALFGVILVVYLFTFNGQFTSIDELALYGNIECHVQPCSSGNHLVDFARFHNPVGSHEPGYSIAAAPLYFLAKLIPSINRLHLVQLFNPIALALTSTFLFLLSRNLGYSIHASVFAAFGLAFGTYVWTYSRSLYREPLVALLWTAALLCISLWRNSARRGWLYIAFVCLALGPVVKMTAVVGIPIILLATARRHSIAQNRTRWVLITLMVLTISIVLFGVAWSLRPGISIGRDRFENLNFPIFLHRLAGQVLSPGKGILFYAPVVILVIPGAFALYQRSRSFCLVSVALPLCLAAAYGPYASWYGGQSWGPRFLLPALPIFLVPLAALWDKWRSRTARAALVIILIASISLLLPSVIADWWHSYLPLFSSGPIPEETSAVFDLGLSPPLNLWKHFQIDHLNLLWLHPNLEGLLSLNSHSLLTLCTALVVSLFLMFRAFTKSSSYLYVAVVLIVSLFGVLHWGAKDIPGYPGLSVDTAHKISNWVEPDSNEPYRLATVSNEFHIYYYLGLLRGTFDHHWISPADEHPAICDLEELKKIHWTSLVVDRVHLTPDLHGRTAEWCLSRAAFRVDSDWIDGYEVFRYAYFPGDSFQWTSTDIELNDRLHLTNIGITDGQVELGQTLGIQLEFDLDDYQSHEEILFVHLLGPQVIEGLDGSLGYGSPQINGDTTKSLVENRAIRIPNDAAPSTYQLVVGTYSSTDGASTTESDAQPYIAVATIEVVDTSD
ncbi:MAG: hypothetical protein ABFQ89_05410 [Chloroflexota bacterium]